jgi:hypothetical protein
MFLAQLHQAHALIKGGLGFGVGLGKDDGRDRIRGSAGGLRPAVPAPGGNERDGERDPKRLALTPAL